MKKESMEWMFREYLVIVKKKRQAVFCSLSFSMLKRFGTPLMLHGTLLQAGRRRK